MATYNQKNGRGGQTAAGKKYGISALSLSAWMKATAPEGGKKRGRKAGANGSSANASLTGRLKAVNTLASQIDQAQDDLARMKAKFKSLLAAL